MMNDEKRQEIKDLIDSRWEEEKLVLCNDIMEGYIFGKYADHEHYMIDEIIGIWDEIYLEKNPLPVVEEEVVEEPIEE
jgi:hypothetical protein